jgi:Bacterial regulatory proteins, luxR family
MDQELWRTIVHRVGEALIEWGAGANEHPGQISSLSVHGFTPLDEEGGERHGSWVWPLVLNAAEGGGARYVSLALTEVNATGTGRDYLLTTEGGVEDGAGRFVRMHLGRTLHLSADRLLGSGVDTMANRLLMAVEGVNHLPAAGESTLPAQTYVFAEHSAEPKKLGEGPSLGEAADKLTSRERQVYELLSQGSRPEEVSATLGVSESTARRLISSVRRKLGAGWLGTPPADPSSERRRAGSRAS